MDKTQKTEIITEEIIRTSKVFKNTDCSKCHRHMNLPLQECINCTSCFCESCFHAKSKNIVHCPCNCKNAEFKEQTKIQTEYNKVNRHHNNLINDKNPVVIPYGLLSSNPQNNLIKHCDMVITSKIKDYESKTTSINKTIKQISKDNSLLNGQDPQPHISSNFISQTSKDVDNLFLQECSILENSLKSKSKTQNFKICSSCNLNLEKSKYSKNQYKLPSNKRKCTYCINNSFKNIPEFNDKDILRLERLLKNNEDKDFDFLKKEQRQTLPPKINVTKKPKNKQSTTTERLFEEIQQDSIVPGTKNIDIKTQQQSLYDFGKIQTDLAKMTEELKLRKEELPSMSKMNESGAKIEAYFQAISKTQSIANSIFCDLSKINFKNYTHVTSINKLDPFDFKQYELLCKVSYASDDLYDYLNESIDNYEDVNESDLDDIEEDFDDSIDLESDSEDDMTKHPLFKTFLEDNYSQVKDKQKCNVCGKKFDMIDQIIEHIEKFHMVDFMIWLDKQDLEDDGDTNSSIDNSSQIQSPKKKKNKSKSKKNNNANSANSPAKHMLNGSTKNGFINKHNIEI